MSALIFVRDGRTLPWVPVTVEALTAIREHTPKGRPYAVATYMALLEFANEARGDRMALAQREIVDRVGASRSTVQAAISALVSAGVLVVLERTHGNARVENEYVIVEPGQERAESGTPARETGDPRPSGGQRSLEEGIRPTEPRTRAKRATVDQDALPDDFPSDLVPALESVMSALTEAAAGRGAPAPARAAVGRAMAKRPRKPHAIVAERVAHWLLFGNGQRASCRDVVARWRDWCDQEPDVAVAAPIAAMAPNVHQIRGNPVTRPGRVDWGHVAETLEAQGL